MNHLTLAFEGKVYSVGLALLYDEEDGHRLYTTIHDIWEGHTVFEDYLMMDGNWDINEKLLDIVEAYEQGLNIFEGIEYTNG